MPLNEPSPTGWQQRPEGGTTLALRTTAWLTLHLPRVAVDLVLSFVALYFLIVRSSERRASREFLARVFKRPVSLWQVYAHFRTFARVTADRVLFLANRFDGIPLTIDGWDVMERIVQRGRGCVMLGSHFGSFEASRVPAARHDGVTLRMVLDRATSGNLVRELSRIDPDFGASIIDADQPAAALGLAISEALNDGKSIGFLADRCREGDRRIPCEFLGTTAEFPAGPLMIAAALQAPVVMLFSSYHNGRYKIRCEPFSDAFRLPREGRNDRLADEVQRYADRLADYVRESPYNWFNFYDFWKLTSP